MKRTDAMKRAAEKYEAEKVDRVFVRFPKGKKEVVQEFAARRGESLNAFINRAVDMLMAEESKQ